MTHDLKTWPEPFTAVLNGTKTHEIRVADRPFAVGDTLHLREYNRASSLGQGGYTGRSCRVEVTYISAGGMWGLPANLCAMSIRKVDPPRCVHGVTFDELAARGLGAVEIRRRWPRLDGECPLGCGYRGIFYASMAHVVFGDW
jgi:hypothetical protein